MTINLKSNKGFTIADSGIAMLIAVLLATILNSIFYNVYLNVQESRRTATALNYSVDLFESIGQKDFQEITPTYSLFDIFPQSEIEEKGISDTDGTVTVNLKTYTMSVKIENYKNCDKIKIITLKVDYPVSRKNSESFELQRIKVEEEI